MKIFDIINEGAIDYTKPGPVRQSSLGQKLEYGIPVNDQGQFVNPNKIPNYKQLTESEYSAMTTAYNTWLENYLTRWPEATQQPDGTWRGLKSESVASEILETYNHGFADPHAPSLGSRQRRDFKRQEMEHELGHETNNYAVAIDGRTWKVFASKSHADAVARSLQNKGKKATVHETGSPVSESATAGATSAANMAVGPVYKNKPPKQPKNKDGTAKNALDMNANLMTGGSIKR